MLMPSVPTGTSLNTRLQLSLATPEMSLPPMWSMYVLSSDGDDLTGWRVEAELDDSGVLVLHMALQVECRD